MMARGTFGEGFEDWNIITEAMATSDDWKAKRDEYRVKAFTDLAVARDIDKDLLALQEELSAKTIAATVLKVPRWMACVREGGANDAMAKIVGHMVQLTEQYEAQPMDLPTAGLVDIHSLACSVQGVQDVVAKSCHHLLDSVKELSKRVRTYQEQFVAGTSSIGMIKAMVALNDGVDDDKMEGVRSAYGSAVGLVFTCEAHVAPLLGGVARILESLTAEPDIVAETVPEEMISKTKAEMFLKWCHQQIDRINTARDCLLLIPNPHAFSCPSANLYVEVSSCAAAMAVVAASAPFRFAEDDEARDAEGFVAQWQALRNTLDELDKRNWLEKTPNAWSEEAASKGSSRMAAVHWFVAEARDMKGVLSDDHQDEFYKQLRVGTVALADVAGGMLEGGSWKSTAADEGWDELLKTAQATLFSKKNKGAPGIMKERRGNLVILKKEYDDAAASFGWEIVPEDLQAYADAVKEATASLAEAAIINVLKSERKPLSVKQSEIQAEIDSLAEYGASSGDLHNGVVAKMMQIMAS